MNNKLLKFNSYKGIYERKLIDIYAESNWDNTDYFYPDERDKAKAVKQVEADFLDFLEKDFLKQDGSTLWVLEVKSEWVSALRTSKIRDRLYYLEALETSPDQRHKGYASLLLSAVIDALKKDGPFRLCDCVSKKNIASLKTHEKCGFKIVSESGYDYLQKTTNDREYGFAYSFDGTVASSI